VARRSRPSGRPTASPILSAMSELATAVVSAEEALEVWPADPVLVPDKVGGETEGVDVALVELGPVTSRGGWLRLVKKGN